MKKLPLIKQLQENGAVGAGSVAMAATPLFATLVKRSKGPKVKVKKIDFAKHEAVAKRSMGVKESFNSSLTAVTESMNDTDATGIVSKLKSLENKDKTDIRDFATFGLEDEKGNVVKVSVPKDQGADFEKAIQIALSDDDDTDAEIAEVLFTLKDRFTILDVDWGEIEEDEEVAPADSDLPDGEAPVDGDLELDTEPVGPGTEEVSSLLTQIIDMMKADAEARKSEAQARQAESKAKEAEAAAAQAAMRVKQEEQILDMESHEKKQKDVDKEAKRLAKLAKWRHDMANEEGVDDSDVDEIIPPYTSEVQHTENEEQTIGAVKRVTPSELATLLLKRT